MLLSAIQWSESAVYICIPSLLDLPPTYIPHPTLKSPPSWAPCAIQQLSTSSLFLYGSVYMSILISQFVPPSPSLLCPQAHYLYLHVYSCPGHRFICTIFLDSTYTAARTRKQPKCPMTDEWIKKMWCIFMMEYYSAIKRSETGPSVEMWVDLQSVIQSEVSQKEKSKYGPSMFSWTFLLSCGKCCMSILLTTLHHCIFLLLITLAALLKTLAQLSLTFQQPEWNPGDLLIS